MFNISTLPILKASTKTRIADPNYDSEVLDWTSRVQGQGGSVSQSTKNAANTFMLSLKNNNIRSKIYRCNIYAGTGLNSVKAPLINSSGSVTDTLNSFVSGDYSESTGLTGASGKYIDTGFIHNLLPGVTNNHISVYVRTSLAEATVAIGVGGASNVGGTYLFVYHANTNTYFNDCGAAEFGIADSVGTGLYQGNRTTTNDVTIYKNGSVLGTNSTTGGSLIAARSFSVHCHNGDGIPSQFCTKPISYYSIGAGMTSGEITAHYNAVQTLQTTLGRQV